MRGSRCVVQAPNSRQEEERRFVRPLDLNALIRGLKIKLRCTLGQGVRLKFRLATELPPTYADLVISVRFVR